MKRRQMAIEGLQVFLIALCIVIPSKLNAQSERPFVPKDFQVPEKLETERFRLRMLTVNDVVKDFDAVKGWVKTAWPFKNASYPGRDVDWKAWEGVPE